jgi:hypothetical protein
MAEKAQSWGEAIQVIFDLHRDDIRTGMALRPIKDADDENQLLSKLSAFLLAGRKAPDRSDLFDAPAKDPTASLLSSPNVTAELLDDEIADRPEQPTAAPTVLRSLRHLITITRAVTEDEVPDPVNADVYVNEPRARSVGDDLPAFDEGGAHASATVDPGEPVEILWQVSGLAPAASITLAYELPLWTLDVSGPASGRVTFLPAIGHEVELTPPASGADAILEIRRFSASSGRPTLHGPRVSALPSTANLYRWRVASLDSPHTLIVELPDEGEA